MLKMSFRRIEEHTSTLRIALETWQGGEISSMLLRGARVNVADICVRGYLL
jgi:hypothetical protein